MVDGFINDDFTADGSITVSNLTSSNSFDGANFSIVPGTWVSNLGITYASSTLSVTSADGTALSSSNPGYVILQSSSNPGQLVTYTVTENQGFIDDTGASEIIGNLFGLTTGVAYAQDVPFYIYAVGNNAEDAIAFMISRVPGKCISPVVAEIGAPDDAVADNQYSFFSFDNIDETLYDTNPCICIGSFRMRMSAADDWTVQALDIQDGIGRFQERRAFSVLVGAFGAAAGTHWLDNGGTAPVFTTHDFYYQMSRNGVVQINLRSGTLTNVPAGAVINKFCLPFISAYRTQICGRFLDGGTGNVRSSTISIQNTGTFATNSSEITYAAYVAGGGGSFQCSGAYQIKNA